MLHKQRHLCWIQGFPTIEFFFSSKASFRGYRVRERLYQALAAARECRNEAAEDDDDFDYDEEIDLTSFDFNEESLDWRPSSFPEVPQRYVEMFLGSSFLESPFSLSSCFAKNDHTLTSQD